jgi:cytochrome P450/CRP-like cAMP-binding protein
MVRAYHRHGPVYRLRHLGQDAVVLAGLAANEFYVEHEARLFQARRCYRHLSSEGGTDYSFIGLEGEAHLRHRRQMRLAFSRQLLAPTIPTLVARVEATARSWRSGQSFHALTLMSNLLLGQSASGLLGSDLEPTAYEPINTFSKTYVGVGVDVQPAALLMQPAYRRSKRRFFALIDELFDAHTASPPPGQRLLNQIDIARAATYEDGTSLNDRDSKACTYFSLVMNSAYTNRAVANLLYALLRDPALMERVLAEVDAAYDVGPITITSLQRMTLLRAAARESLRLYPIPVGLPRHATEDFEFGGYTIRKGQKLYVAICVTHFLPELFPEPYRFDPDRLLPPREEQRQPWAFMPFGIGAHACLGQNLAVLLTMTTMVGLLRAVRFQLQPSGYRVWRLANPLPGPSRMRVTVESRTRPPAPASPQQTLIDEDEALFEGLGLDRDGQDRLIAQMTRRVYQPGEVIIRQGDMADAFYMIASGAAEVFLEQPGQPPRKLERLTEGAIFGEIGLLQGVRRTATVRVTPEGPATINVMDREAFTEAVAEFDLVEAEIVAVVRRRTQQLALAKALPLLSREQIARLSPAFQSRAFAPGVEIIRQGDPAEEFYLVTRGSVEVFARQPGGREIRVAESGAGEYFGEIGLLQERPRTATVRAGPGGVEVLILGRDAFRTLVAGSTATASAVTAEMTRRLLELAGEAAGPEDGR